ncbi:hypothetical protein ACIA49_39080 [Kribbella sp. NPDC051587]|uniref:hypothetical protein n=1 Tax=Kribbella sp. NPDC051587 TaxID=3364119 RepID=UPI0037B651C4
MLVSKDGGRTYLGGWGRRPMTKKLPNQPAAIPIYDGTGMTRLLALDLDVKKTDELQVLRDATTAQRVLEAAGGRVIVDQSPSGGRHLYLPLAEAISLGEATTLVRALQARLPSLDPQPMLNAKFGVIRPPGSLYKMGKGYQQLITPLAVAYDILQRPAGADTITNLRLELASEIQARRQVFEGLGTLSDDLADQPWHARTGGPRPLTAAFRCIAEQGVYDTARYKTPSDARQAVLCSAMAAGMRLEDVARRMESGHWAGLNSFYQRYHAKDRRKALLRDWKNADLLLRGMRRSPSDQESTVRQSDTRGQVSQGGRKGGALNDYQALRLWTAAVDDFAPDNLTPDQHMVLRTLAEAAQKRGSLDIEFGVRSLSVAAGKQTHQALAKHLVLLREQDDPFIELVEEHQGTVADRYRLRLPERYDTRSFAGRPWRKGKIYGIRAAFRELGTMAALTYETLENMAEPTTGRGIAKTMRRSPDAVATALLVLAAWDLAEKVDGHWRLSPRADLNMVAELLGITDEITLQLQRIRQERQDWWKWLGVRRIGAAGRVQQPPPNEHDLPIEIPEHLIDGWADRPTPPAPPEDPGLRRLRLLDQVPPPELWIAQEQSAVPDVDPHLTLLRLLEQTLGAEVLRVTDASRA